MDSAADSALALPCSSLLQGGGRVSGGGITAVPAGAFLSWDEVVAVERAAWALRGKWDSQALPLGPLSGFL